MDTTTGVLHALHIVAAMLMAWPYYALAAVNQRVRLGPPLGDRTDRFMENVLKNRTTACFVFQLTILAGGFALIWANAHAGTHNANFYLSNWAMIAKIVILIAMAASLSVVRFILQPEIDRLFGDYGDISDGDKARIASLRLLRKRMSSACMMLAFSAAVLGVKFTFNFPVWVLVVLLALVAAWTFWSYKSTTKYGWI